MVLVEKNMFSHRFKFIFPGLLAVYSFWNIITLEGDRLFQADLSEGKLFTVIFLLSYAVWFSNFAIEKFMLPISQKFHPLISQFIASIFAVSAIALISVQLSGFFFGGAFNFTLQNFLLTIGFTLRINLFLNCLNAIYFFNKKLGEKALEAEKLKTLTYEAKLQAVNSQLNPHFFFNNLSALSSLIHQNVHQADEYLLRLSKIYRYILANQSRELVSLEEELDFLQDYISLLTIRFKDSLSFDLVLDKNCVGMMIPPAVLQLLVENVVKHNYFTVKDPLEIKLVSDCKNLQISNKKQPKLPTDISTGIGLQNISDRYKFLYLAVIIEDDPDLFKVVLPLIKADEYTFSRRRTASSTANS